MEITRFNIRVYGIMFNELNQILLSDELIIGHYITKFPGGGLEFGEGITDCLKREFLEETNNSIEVISHFYTTDFFQQSAYNPSHQIISIYYLVKPGPNFYLETSVTSFDFKENVDEAQSFRWINMNELTENHVSLPIDKIVVNLLIDKNKNGQSF